MTAAGLCEAWIQLVATATANKDHSIDEARVETIKLTTGGETTDQFTIYGECLLGRTYGEFKVRYAWST